MADFDNTNKGALFQAKEKKTDKHPDYDGFINVDGHDYWVSGWKKVSKNGKTYLSLAVDRYIPKPKEGPVPAPKSDFPDDDIPF